MKKVIVGMSGGVDSSVAALALMEAGYDVTGVSMTIYKGEDMPGASKGCYGREATEDKQNAAEICQKLGIPFYVFDCSEEYKHTVLKYFKDEYLSGRTPNPCVRCNLLMKFGLLPKKAEEAGLDFDYFATGHYAQIFSADNGRLYLKQAEDKAKDQTYFLFRLSQEQLAKTLFPLGGKTKAEVRELARKSLGIIGDKPDSQDFYGGDYNDILGLPAQKGQIVHANGKVLGYHNGFWNYTLGQRKGLGIAYPVPLYVVALDAENNLVLVDEESSVLTYECYAEDFSFYPLSDASLQGKIRSSQTLQEVADVVLNGTEALVRFANPVKAVTPGQSVAIYQDSLLVGGGTIKKK